MERWLTPKKVAEMTGFAVGTLDNWRSQRRGPKAYKNGKTVRYREKDIKEWWEKHFNPIEMVNDLDCPVGRKR